MCEGRKPRTSLSNSCPGSPCTGVTDCSFVASLCVTAALDQRFKKCLITPIVYPQCPAGKMVYNPQGKYIVKLWLNGCARQIVVDDRYVLFRLDMLSFVFFISSLLFLTPFCAIDKIRLPIDKHGNLLCAHTNCPSGQLELYVPIIEKAYLKMSGGYDFPGSNSGVDLFALTGWIPERILFPKHPPNVRDFETEPERAWERLMSAHSFGDCLISMSSDADVTDEEADRMGLVTGHAYAVLNVVQTRSGTRLLMLKNPWCSKVSPYWSFQH